MADVTVTITSDNVGVQRANFGKILILGYNCPVDFTERVRSYASLSELGEDFATTTVEYLCAAQIFGQDPAPDEIMVGRGALPPTMVTTVNVATAAEGREYALHVEGEGVTDTDISYTALADIAIPYIDSGALTVDVVAVAKTFTRTTGSWLTDGFVPGMSLTFSGFTNAGNNTLQTIDVVTDTVITVASATGLVDESGNGNERGAGPKVDWNIADTFYTASAHGMTTGDGPYRFTNSGGALPGNTAVDTDYWIIVLTSTTFQIATSKALALAGTEVNLSGSGTGTHTLQRDANDVICAQLVQGLNAVVGKNYTAAQTAGAGDTDYITITAAGAADWFSVEVADPTSLLVEMTHTDPGVATDLAAIVLEDDSWYTLLTNYNSNAYALAAAAWVESAGLKTYAIDTNDTESETTADGNSETLDDLHTLNRARCVPFYHRKPQEFLAAAAMGRYLPYDPGAATLKFKTLSGVSAISYTSTQRGNLEDRQVNYYRSQRGVSMIANGTTSGGTLPNYFDVRRDVDWLQDDMEAGVFAVLAAAAKVPFTDEGISIVLKEVRASLDRAVKLGVIAAGYTLSAPLAADVSDADKLARILPDIKWRATLAGAVHGVDISGIVSV